MSPPTAGGGREDGCPPGRAIAPARRHHDRSCAKGRAERGPSPGDARPQRPGRRPGVVLGVVVLGAVMAFIDATIVNISVPSIAAQFPGSRLSSISWVLNAYNIVFAAFLIGGGQLADVFGRRRVFTLALGIFTGASALCALAPTLAVLVLARVVQAGGAAMLIPSSLAIVLDAYPPERRVRAITLWAAAAAAAAGVGPPLGGLLITASGWRLVFLVNVPIGLVTLVLARAIVPESRRPGARRLPDLLGEAALSLAVATFVLAIVKGEEWGWLSARLLAALAAACLLCGAFLARCRRNPGRLIDPALLRCALVRSGQWRDRGARDRLLRLHAVQRAVPDRGLALLDPAGGPGPDARPRRGDGRGSRREPPDRALRPPRRDRSRSADLGCGPRLHAEHRRRAAGLPRHAAAR